MKARWKRPKKGGYKWSKRTSNKVTKEVTEIAHKEVVSSTLEEEKRRRARRLNIRVSGIKETTATPEEDGKKIGRAHV